jgi:hypothetical protein
MVVGPDTIGAGARIDTPTRVEPRAVHTDALTAVFTHGPGLFTPSHINHVRAGDANVPALLHVFPLRPAGDDPSVVVTDASRRARAPDEARVLAGPVHVPVQIAIAHVPAIDE